MNKSIFYKIKRENIKTGDLFFTASDSLVSRFIRFFTRSKVSHTGMFVWTKWKNEKRLMCVENVMDGFRTTFSSAYIENCKANGETFYFGGMEEQKIPKEYKILQRVEAYSGRQYDTAGALVSLFRQNQNKNFYCSEFVAKCLDLRKNASEKGFTPDDLAELCVEFNKIV